MAVCLLMGMEKAWEGCENAARECSTRSICIPASSVNQTRPNAIVFALPPLAVLLAKPRGALRARPAEFAHLSRPTEVRRTALAHP